jgi:hypothetical protein
MLNSSQYGGEDGPPKHPAAESTEFEPMPKANAVSFFGLSKRISSSVEQALPATSKKRKVSKIQQHQPALSVPTRNFFVPLRNENMVSKEGQPEPTSDDDPASFPESKNKKLERPPSLIHRRDVISYPYFLSKRGETTTMQPNFSMGQGSQGSHSHP